MLQYCHIRMAVATFIGAVGVGIGLFLFIVAIGYSADKYGEGERDQMKACVDAGKEWRTGGRFNSKYICVREGAGAE